MKNLSYFIILAVSFSVFQCKCINKLKDMIKAEPKDNYIIIKFEDDIYLPQSVMLASDSAYSQYQNLQNQYYNIQTSNGSDFSFKDTPTNYTDKFNAGLFSVFNENVSLKPLFNRIQLDKLYRKFPNITVDSTILSICTATPKSKLPSNLNQYFKAAKCLSRTDAIKFIQKLNNLGLNFTATLGNSGNLERKNNEVGKALTAIKNEDFYDFRKAMNIDLLNVREKINGDSAKIVILEHAQTIDFTHLELQRLQGQSLQPFEKIGSGGSPTHATNTFGIIFSEIGVPHANTSQANIKYAEACKGVASNTKLRKMIYYGDSECDGESDVYNAILNAIVATEKGDIMLIEYDWEGFPIEFDPLSNILVLTAANNLGVTVVEPIGNDGGNLDNENEKEDRKLLGIKTPKSFGGILVGATDAKKIAINTTSSSITCFAYGDKLLTTHNSPKDSYSLFGSTSGASAIIAGLACDMQGYYKGRTGCYLSPQQMKNLFRNTKSSLKVFADKNKTLFGGINGQVIPDAIELKKAVDRL